MTSLKLTPLPDGPLGVAVSGGGDSMALLMLLHQAGHQIYAATVDHQLRDGSAAEAQQVAAHCAGLGISHDILNWQNRPKTGNLQNEARLARQQLLTEWAHQNGLQNIALGHTLDDQAETVLLRLARGSGVDGLAGMAAQRNHGGIIWHRPMLNISRADLREYLRQNKVGWVDDPSNDNTNFDRIKARKALEILSPMGIDQQGLADTARHMLRAKDALEIQTQALARDCVTIRASGEVCLDSKSLFAAPQETQLRLLATALCWVSGAAYRPRFTALSALLLGCCKAQSKTLHGCIVKSDGVEIALNRELSAIKVQTADQPIWERWEIEPRSPNQTVKALGAIGLPQCPDWRDSGHSRVALLASPSLWQEKRLISAPLANFGDKWRVNLAGGKKGFYDLPITH